MLHGSAPASTNAALVSSSWQKKIVFAQPLRIDLDPRNAFGLQQGEECRFKFTQLMGEIRGKQSVGASNQPIAACAKGEAAVSGLAQNFQRGHKIVSPSGSLPITMSAGSEAGSLAGTGSIFGCSAGVIS